MNKLHRLLCNTANKNQQLVSSELSWQSGLPSHFHWKGIHIPLVLQLNSLAPHVGLAIMGLWGYGVMDSVVGLVVESGDNKRVSLEVLKGLEWGLKGAGFKSKAGCCNECLVGLWSDYRMVFGSGDLASQVYQSRWLHVVCKVCEV